MASYSHPHIETYKAGGVIGANKFVKFGADDLHVVICGAGDKAIGVSMSAATAAEDVIEVAELGGGGKVTLGGTVARGDSLKPDANGDAVAATTGNVSSGVAFNSGVDNDVIGLKLDLHAAP